MPDDGRVAGDTRGELTLDDPPEFDISGDDFTLDGAQASPFYQSSEGLDDDEDAEYDDADADDAEGADEATQEPTTAATKGLALNQSTREAKLAALSSADPEDILTYVQGLQGATTRAQQEAADLRRQTQQLNERFDALEQRVTNVKPTTPDLSQEPNPTDLGAWTTWFQAQTSRAPEYFDLTQAKERYELRNKVSSLEGKFSATETAQIQRNIASERAAVQAELGLDEPTWQRVEQLATEHMNALGIPAAKDGAFRSAVWAIVGPALHKSMTAAQQNGRTQQQRRVEAAATPPPSSTGAPTRPSPSTADDVLALQKQRKRARR